jgi:hypothetical protein
LSEEFEESLPFLVKTALPMGGIPHLHGSVSRVEILAAFLVLPFFPVFLLTVIGAVHDGLANTAAGERDIYQFNDLTEAAALGRDYAWSKVK